MLIRFAVENYNSFKDRQVFSMVAGKQTRHATHCVTAHGVNLLKSSFFFGANASGKTNFVRALDFMRRITLRGTDAMRHSDRYFRIDPAYKEKPGVVQIDFISNQRIFSYGFAINYLTRKICGEWLYRIESPEEEVCIFERRPDSTFSTDLSLDKKSQMRFEIYCNDLKPNKLLLNEIASKNLEAASPFTDFLFAYDWFKKLLVVYPDSHVRNPYEFFLNPASDTDSMAKMLYAFDTGIEGIMKGKQPAEEAFAFLPDEVKKDLLDALEQSRDKIQGNDHFTVEIGKYQFEIALDGDEIIAEKIMLDHGNVAEPFEFSDESDGTKRLFDLIPLYEFGQKERIIVIDELDRSFHSKLTQEFIRLFFELTEGKPSQLICTTHDLNLMDLEILRKDEIWFVEREKDHSTRIYSLSDYRLKFDKELLNDYLIGRYGAVPCFRDNEWQEDCE